MNVIIVIIGVINHIVDWLSIDIVIVIVGIINHIIYLNRIIEGISIIFIIIVAVAIIIN